MIDVTVSVVVYRDYETPRALIDSICANTDPSLSFELIVVDNTESVSLEGLSSKRQAFFNYVEKLEKVRLIVTGRNLGFGKAHNIALAQTESRYHLFANPDIVLIEDSLNKLKDFMDSNPTVGMCIPKIISESGELQPVYREEVTVFDAVNRTLLKNALRSRGLRHTLQDRDYSQVFQVPFGQGSFMFGRTELLRELGGFDERFFMYLEDADLCKRLNQRSLLVYFPHTQVVHEWQRGSHRDISLFRIHCKSYMEYFQKWGWRFR